MRRAATRSELVTLSVRNGPHIGHQNRALGSMPASAARSTSRRIERRELVRPLWLEGCSVEEPDRESANRDDAEEDQDEGDIGLPLRVVLGEPVHALVRTRRHDARRLAKTYGRNADA